MELSRERGKWENAHLKFSAATAKTRYKQDVISSFKNSETGRESGVEVSNVPEKRISDIEKKRRSIKNVEPGPGAPDTKRLFAQCRSQTCGKAEVELFFGVNYGGGTNRAWGQVACKTA